jgi:Holliday junction resolvase RusA-like endonuclease
MNSDISQCWLEIPVEPPKSTHQSALRVLKSKSGRMFVGKMKNNKASQWLTLIRPHLIKAKPPFPAEGAVRVHIKFYYTCPKYLLPKINKCKILVKTTKPDLDNSVKSLLDELTKLGWWLDDSQIWSITIEKYWSLTPKVCLHYDTKTNNE